MTRDQAKRIAQAIFDDVEQSRLFNLDRVTDVIQRESVRMCLTQDTSGMRIATDSGRLLVRIIEAGMLPQISQSIIQPDD